VRSPRGGREEDQVQIIVSTDLMILAACHPLSHATRHPPNTAHHTPPASLFPVPGVCNSTSLWIQHVGGVQFSMGSFWPMEHSEFVEAIANRRL
jgi:hypothetical protein